MDYCEENYGKDFPSCMMVLGSMLVALHYEEVIANPYLGNIGFPMLFGRTSTSKSSCLDVLLATIGVFQNDYGKQISFFIISE